MFGYIRPYKPEMLIRDFEQYRGVYCGLCKQLGKSYGVAARAALSYDCTFYAIYLMSVASGACCAGFHQSRCVVNPLKKCTYCAEDLPALKMAAALSAIMTYYKIKDDWADGSGLQKLRAVFARPFFSRARKKAARDFPALEQAIAASMAKQAEIEKSQDAGLDACAEPTAQMLAQSFQLGAQYIQPGSTVLPRLAEQFGYYIGRWVYLMDAADDFEKDIRSGGFNPFLTKFQLTRESAPQEVSKTRVYANEVLNMSLSQAIAAFELTEFHCFSPILRNIVTMGLPQMQKQKLFKKGEEKCQTRTKS